MINQLNLAPASFRFRPYQSYKDSGVEWLGEIPAHWEVKRLKNVTQINPEVLPETADPDYALQYIDITNVNEKGSIIDVQELRFEDAPSRARRIVGHGDTIISTVRTYLKAIGFIDNPPENLIVSTGFAVLRAMAGVKPAFLWRLVQSQQFVAFVVSHSEGVSYPAINPSRLACLPILLPPTAEQAAITGFIDQEAAKIDALVGKKERQIELLQEKRTALLSQAVTKGLDPTVPMKNSGVEWLGYIPPHWQVSSVKRFASRIQTGSTPPTSEEHYYEDGEVPWFGPGSFGVDLVLIEPVKLISPIAVQDGVARIFESGSTMIVTIGATIGKVGYIQFPASSNQQITGITFSLSRVRAKFAAYQMKRLEPVLRGIAPSSTLPILDQQKVGYLPFVLPPIDEQTAIINFLDQETVKIDGLIAKIREGLDKLREYRTALISAAVTGKIDVREARNS